MSRFGRYQEDDLWREFRMGRVWRARLPEMHRSVYLRELALPAHLPAAERAALEERFDLERRLLAGIDEPRLPRPWDFGETREGNRFLVFERPESSGFYPVAGVGGADVEARLAIAAEAARALHRMTAAGLVQDAFDPTGLFVAPNGAVRYLHLGFLEYARSLGLPPEGDGDGGELLAPELRAGGSADSRSLVFSLAAWLYGSLAGPGAPAPGEAAARGERVPALAERNSAVRYAVSDALQRALDPNPAGRPGGLLQFAESLGQRGPLPLGTVAAASAPAEADPQPVIEADGPLPAGWIARAALAAGAGFAAALAIELLR